MNSKARYIAFMDADDKVDPDFYTSLLEAARYTGAEVTQGEFCFWRGNMDSPNDLSDSYEKEMFREWRRDMLGSLGTYRAEASLLIIGQPTIWRRVYRRDFLDHQKIWFPEHIRAFDDQIFHHLSLHCAKSIVCVDGAKYYYRQHKGQDIRAGDERFFYSLEMFRLLFKRGLKEGWSDFSPFVQSFANSVVWITSNLRADLVAPFREGAAELWIMMSLAIGLDDRDLHGADLGEQFWESVGQNRIRLGNVRPTYAWLYLDNGIFHVGKVKAPGIVPRSKVRSSATSPS